ncbi:GGDEF domain-containing protein [soil metagenome]
MQALPPPNLLTDFLLGTDRAQRLRLRQAGLAMVLMALSVGVTLLAAHQVGLALSPVLVWAAVSMAGLVAAYLAIRSGWSLHFKDPSLTLPQMSYAIASSAWGYTLVPPARAIAFPILMIIFMFGMFQLRARSALGISVYALACFGVAMSVMTELQPREFPVAVELVHFLMLALTLPTVSVLAGRLSSIRTRLGVQKAALTEALAQIQAMALRDELTGLVNRRHMQALLEQETLRCARTGRSYCVALLDIDHFKRINDRHGHAAGDAALRAFASAAQAAIRSADVLARWGGEEFVLMLADTTMPLALAGLERLRAQVAAMEIAVGGKYVQLTVSAGLTEHLAGETLAQTLERADKLLYEAKAAGRNRLVSG